MSLTPMPGLEPQQEPELPKWPGDHVQCSPSNELEARRFPHIGHAALLFAFAVVLVVLFVIGAMVLGGVTRAAQGGDATSTHPLLLILAQAAAYLGTVAVAWLYFPMVWKQPFLIGMSWQWPVARGRFSKLVALGFLMGAAAAAATVFIKTPKTLPLDKFFLSPVDGWFLFAFGIFVAPAFEEICYRGFLLPALAIAYDWLAMPRTPETTERSRSTDALSQRGLVVAALVSSIAFAMMHFEQDAHLWSVMIVLFCVSLVLSVVRLKTKSVAASTIVHAAYNSFQMLAIAIGTSGFRHLDKLH